MSIENLQIYPIGKNININSVLMLNNKYQKQTTYAKIIQKFNILIKGIKNKRRHKFKQGR